MERLTRQKDKWECRIAECPMENYIYDLTGECPDNVCGDCFFEEIVNKLAEYEDLEEEGKVNRA